MSTEKCINRAFLSSEWRNLMKVAKAVVNEGNVTARVAQGDDIMGNVVAPVSDYFGAHYGR